MSIQLRSRRGPIGTAWQAVALREAAERLLGPGRAGRGRTDARAGRVQWLEVEPGAARAAVEDPDGGLHQARLDLPAYRDGDREVFLQVARAHPELPARLAAGTYPEQIETELAPSMLSLLPRDAAELSHDCDCLDWPGPCRHVSALVYVLVEAVDEHPVHLLTLRGIRLEELVAPVAPAAGAAGPPRGEDAHGSGDGPPDASDEAEAAPEPAPYDPRHTDPARLAEVVGEEVAAIIAAFYHAGTAEASSGGPAGHPGGELVDGSGGEPVDGTGGGPERD
ncbi:MULTISPECIES: hypothetical protein [Brachybacterium]|uniref:SWIM-type domain-containing protein n=2 Tax=Brachybacterium TaxID=43668 RepID=A0A3R8QU16_9MICO|nr:MULTISPECIES: hypothetical protein [Brachybacterium]RRR17960.1 hypothetical protein DS079_11775 [Brachybacterium paraconglomeratum]GLI29285.1 SWIM zinc finger-containing protein [Brachybacterium conglomeratum]GLK05615.1 SWIM zinc finger-containing protein [Brachybacterium conglomeratum]